MPNTTTTWTPPEPGNQRFLDGHPFDDFASSSILGLEAFPSSESSENSTTKIENRFGFWLGFPRVFLFPSGFPIDRHPFAQLFRSQDIILCSHQASSQVRSLARIATSHQARLRWFDLHQPDELERILLQHRTAARKLILLPSVDPWMSSPAPLQQIHLLSIRHQAWLYVDETASLAVYGRHGRGSSRDSLGPWDHLLVGGNFRSSLGWNITFLATSNLLGRSLDATMQLTPEWDTLPGQCLLPDVIEPRLNYIRELADHLQTEANRLGVPFWGNSPFVKQLLLGNPHEVEAQLRDQQILVHRRPVPPYLQPTAGDILSIQLSALHTPRQLDRLLIALERTQLQPLAPDSSQLRPMRQAM